MNQKEMKRFHANRQTVHCAYVYLACFILDCIQARNQHFRTPEELDRKYLEILGKYFGNPEKDGQLQDDLNKAYHGILKQFRKDFPHYDRSTVLVFSYYAAGIPIPLIHVLAGLSFDKAASVTKTQMKKEINARASERKDEYLMLLEREKLPNWVRSALFG